MSSWSDIVHQVQDRARDRCEYCRMHQALQVGTFHVEHILPSAHGGPSTLDNLAWACPGCNLRKSDRTEIRHTDTGSFVPLYNPRTDRWFEHFRREGYLVLGKTAVGRATVAALDLNHPRRLLIRHAEGLFGLFPP